jgi:hypothetical protein
VPALRLGEALAAPADGRPRWQALWEARPWYPYALAPLWGLALLASAAGGPRRRRRVARALGVLAVGIAVFEACYLRADYLSFLPGALGVLEVTLAWLLVVLLLFHRRRADRAPGGVEAALAAQALLCAAHLVTLPSTMVRPWVGTHDAAAILRSTFANFPPAFWVGVLGCLLVALPVYLRRTSTGSTAPARCP